MSQKQRAMTRYNLNLWCIYVYIKTIKWVLDWLFATPWTVDHQAPLSMEFSRKEYWSWFPFPSQGDLPTQGLNLGLLLAGKFFTVWTTRQAHIYTLYINIVHIYGVLYIYIIPEKAMAPHSSTFAWKIPWMEEPGRLQSMGSLRVGPHWETSLPLFTFMHWRRKWQPTPVFLPGESQGWGSLVGCHLRDHTESDTTEAT